MTEPTTPEPDARAGLRERTSATAVKKAMAWLETNLRRLQDLANQPLLRDFVLEPFTSIFASDGPVTDRQVHKLILQIALMNAAMAAVPGSMGLGVTVAIALEVFMALRIAQLLGFRVNSPWELLQSFTAAAGAAIGILYGFRAIFGLAYSALAILPGPGTVVTFLASYGTTVALGLAMWFAFQELRKTRETLDAIGNREWKQLFTSTAARFGTLIKGTVDHQKRLVKALANPRAIRLVADRASAYLKGQLVVDTPRVRGDLFVPLAMAALITRQTERLDGPMGAMFLDSVRQAHPQLADVTLDQMADYFGQYDAAQLEGVLAGLRGQMFERMVEAAENADGDLWSAALHDDRNVPGSDIVFTHQQTGETIEISLKATDSTSYLEEALRRYPDIPIVTTDEIAGILEHEPLISASGISNADVRTVTEENFEEMLANTDAPRIEAGVAGGIALASFAALYPFLIARARGRIDGDQLKRAVQRVTGEASQKLIVRLSFAAMLGPIFGWYLLARGGGALVNAAEALAEESERLPLRTHRVILATRPTPTAP